MGDNIANKTCAALISAVTPNRLRSHRSQPPRKHFPLFSQNGPIGYASVLLVTAAHTYVQHLLSVSSQFLNKHMEYVLICFARQPVTLSSFILFFFEFR